MYRAPPLKGSLPESFELNTSTVGPAEPFTSPLKHTAFAVAPKKPVAHTKTIASRFRNRIQGLPRYLNAPPASRRLSTRCPARTPDHYLIGARRDGPCFASFVPIAKTGRVHFHRYGFFLAGLQGDFANCLQHSRRFARCFRQKSAITVHRSSQPSESATDSASELRKQGTRAGSASIEDECAPLAGHWGVLLSLVIGPLGRGCRFSSWAVFVLAFFAAFLRGQPVSISS